MTPTTWIIIGVIVAVTTAAPALIVLVARRAGRNRSGKRGGR